MGVNAIPTDEISNCSISIITKKGIYFDDGDVLIVVENIVNKALGWSDVK